MKKILYILGLLLLVLSCEEPLEDAFKEVDEFNKQEEANRLEDERINGSEQLDTIFELTDEDYESIDPADDDAIGRFKNFSSIEQASEKLVPFLKSKFPTFKDNSSAEVTFKLFSPQLRLSNNTISYTVTNDDYESQGGSVASFRNFSSEDQIVTFLKERFDEARFGDLINLTYNFFNGSLETLENKFVFSRNGEWIAPKSLDEEDYEALGQNFPNFSDEEVAEELIAKLLKRETFLEEAGDTKSVLYTFTFFSDDRRQFEDRILNYTFDGNTWEVPSTIQTGTLPFFLKNRVWKSGAITKYTFASDDYNFVASELMSDSDLEDEVGNLSRFGNFNRQDGDTNWDNEELLKGFTIALNNKFPDAESETQFEITIDVWVGSNATESFNLTKQTDGSFIYTVE